MRKVAMVIIFLMAATFWITNAVIAGQKPDIKRSEYTAQSHMKATGDVTIHLNGGDDVAYIGDTNLVEIWIKNSVELAGVDLSFSFLIGRSYEFNPNYYFSNFTKPEGDMDDYLEIHYEEAAIDNTYPDTIHISSADIVTPIFPVHSTHVLAYTMQVYIPPDQPECPGGLCVDNIYDDYVWFFADEYMTYFYPTFQGNPYTSAPPVCFDIVDSGPTVCGDVNCDKAVNVSDAVWIINYVFAGGYGPCDLDGDQLPDC